MRKTLILLLCAGLFATAATAQNVTLNFKNTPLKDVLKEIQNQTDYKFVYNDDQIGAANLVTINVAAQPLTKVLDELFAKNNIGYTISDKQIVLQYKPLAPANSPAPASQTQEFKVSGTILDQDGLSIPGATVMVKGNAKKFTVADANGLFTLSGIEPTAVLVISCIGYETIEMPVNGKGVIIFNLEQAVNLLQDVVVTGYQTISRERATGAYSIITSEKLEQRPTSNIASAMSGLVPGLTVRTSSVDGQTRFLIRGQGSLPDLSLREEERALDMDPLIVVDGFPIQGYSTVNLGGNGLRNSKDPFNTVNPNDIESITVLKDAAATSIYGARASNGVIVITTKKGNRNEKININVSGFVSVSTKPDLNYAFNMASTESSFWYLENLRKYYSGYGSTWYNPYNYPTQPYYVYINDAAALMLEYYDRGSISESEFNSRKAQMIANEGKWENELNKLVYRNAINQQYNISLRGGSEKMTYSFSAAYDNEKTYTQGNDNQRITLNLTNSFQLNNKITLNLGVNGNIAKQTNNGISFTFLQGIISPWTRLVDDNGAYTYMHSPSSGILGNSSYDGGVLYYPILMAQYADKVPVSWLFNPIENRQHMDNTSDRFTMRIHAGLDYKITNGLSAKVMGQYERNQYAARMLYGPESYYVRNYTNVYSTLNAATGMYDSYFPDGGIFNDSGDIFEGYTLRAQIDFQKSFGRHDISAIAGTEILSSTQNNIPIIWRYGYNQNTNAVLAAPDYINQHTNIYGVNRYMPFTTLGSLYTLEDRFFAAYANAAYTYDGKYTLSGSIRTDASNFQAESAREKFSPFWSIGASWLVSHETFMRNVNGVDFLKLRVTLGEAGFAAGKFRTSTITTLSVNAGNPLHTNNEPYNTISARGNPSLTWEKSRNFDIGFSFRLWNSKLYGDFTWYNKYSYDVLSNATVPVITQGVTATTFNNAAVSNKGTEIQLGSRLKIAGDLTWNGILNLSYNKNKVITYNVINTSPRPSYYPGYPINNIWVYKAIGYTNEGYMILQGKDGAQEIVTSRDATHLYDSINGAAGEKVEDYNWIYSLGSSTPKTYLGFTNTFTFNGITLSFLITGKFGYYFESNFSFSSRQDEASYSKTLEKAMAVYNEGYDKQKSYSVLPLHNEANKDIFESGSTWMYTTNLATYVSDYYLKGDHLRLNEVYLGYDLPGNVLGNQKLFRNITVFVQARDLGVIWSANKEVDPDYEIGSIKPMKTFTFGLKFNFN